MAAPSVVGKLVDRPLSSTPPLGGFFQKVGKALADRKKPTVSVVYLHGIIAAGKGGGLGGGRTKINLETTRRIVDKGRSTALDLMISLFKKKMSVKSRSKAVPTPR